MAQPVHTHSTFPPHTVVAPPPITEMQREMCEKFERIALNRVPELEATPNIVTQKYFPPDLYTPNYPKISLSKLKLLQIKEKQIMEEKGIHPGRTPGTSTILPTTPVIDLVRPSGKRKAKALASKPSLKKTEEKEKTVFQDGRGSDRMLRDDTENPKEKENQDEDENVRPAEEEESDNDEDGDYGMFQYADGGFENGDDDFADDNDDDGYGNGDYDD
ncbi:hypothetical protein BLNAU_13471 [Blattamonas nauphoetae]|uniref:DNA-directed RNA polymerase III subunit n=1 Tax=Blattamonas nauphoetae TaxID=2049346 RepID=A0ABQ9XJL0_9EUKA|nr:hypothetical protein BLNAU_13471 [Blattamonas nauphoetae]